MRTVKFIRKNYKERGLKSLILRTSCIEACSWARQTEKARIRGGAESEAMREKERQDKRAEMAPSCSLNRSAARAGAGVPLIKEARNTLPGSTDNVLRSWLTTSGKGRKGHKLRGGEERVRFRAPPEPGISRERRKCCAQMRRRMRPKWSQLAQRRATKLD